MRTIQEIQKALHKICDMQHAIEARKVGESRISYKLSCQLNQQKTKLMCALRAYEMAQGSKGISNSGVIREKPL